MKLTKSWAKEKYEDKDPGWGYNGLGYVVYKRTYAQVKSNGEKEEWWETCLRVTNGMQTVVGHYTQEQLEKIYYLMFYLKSFPAGRGLWQLGMRGVERNKVGDSLQNCWYTEIKDIESFIFLFNKLMQGGGVGFSVQRKHVYDLPKVCKKVKITHLRTDDADYIVPDSREGWSTLLKLVFKSYFSNGRSFTYSTMLVRPKGAPIKGFGGTASGPQILIDAVVNLCKVLDARCGKKVRSIDALDICNILGNVSVAGVRRSAEIAIGDSDDVLFLKAKRWDLGAIPDWRRMSNNTVDTEDTGNLLDLFWEGYEGNGEPYGLANTNLMQKYGRIGELKPDTATGLNPCVSGDTWLTTPTGLKKIKDCVDKAIQVWNGEVYSDVVPKITGYNQEMLRVATSNHALTCTKYHKFISEDGTLVEAKDLKIGDKLKRFTVPTATSFKDYGEQIIISVEECGVAEKVYCFKEPLRGQGTFNNLVTGQCGEATLEDGEPCNLSEHVLGRFKSIEEYYEALALFYMYQKRVCLLKYEDKKTEEVIRRNMRIGVGVTGLLTATDRLEWLDKGYNFLERTDRLYSAKHNLPESIKLTVIKPSGTLSILAGCSPGGHPAFANHWMRNVRFSSNDPLVELCKRAGCSVEYERRLDGTENPDTSIVYFPCKAPEGSRVAASMTAMDQLEFLSFVNKNWSDQSSSVTIYYSKEELPIIIEYLNKNWSDNFKSVSFLLHAEHGFDQAPYQEIDKAMYDEEVKKINTQMFVKGFKDKSDFELQSSLECTDGHCPLK